jgi:glycosyltransferase involved in cell wall biosynthesis
MILRRVETVVAVSRNLARSFARDVGRDREQIEVIYNPIDIDAVQSGTEAIPHDWFEDHVPVVVSAGRLHPQKDYRTLLRAVARLHDRNRRVRAIILGEGPERKRLDELSRRVGISPDTAFPGFVKNPYAFMAQADVFALPSPVEAFGNVVVEALACGTPVVATDSSGGPVEILRTDDATYGFLVPPQDPAAMADALAAMLSRPVDQRRLQRRARDFDVSKAVDRYHALFERMACGAS